MTVQRPFKGKASVGTLVWILFFSAIVIAPLVPAEVAFWKVAQAENALDQGKLTLSNRYLEDALQISERVSDYPPYLALLLRKYFVTQDIEAAFDLVSSRPKPQRVRLGIQFSKYLTDSGAFDVALDALRFAESNGMEESAEQLNASAYARALAGEELDIALDKINLAIQKTRESSELEILKKSKFISFRDTRAWVYFQMGRYEEALEDVEWSVENLTPFYRQRGIKVDFDVHRVPPVKRPKAEVEVLELLASAFKDRPQPGLDQLSRYRAVEREALFQLAVIRYHRALIREALEMEDAQEDFRWLVAAGYSDFELLH